MNNFLKFLLALVLTAIVAFMGYVTYDHFFLGNQICYQCTKEERRDLKIMECMIIAPEGGNLESCLLITKNHPR